MWPNRYNISSVNAPSFRRQEGKWRQIRIARKCRSMQLRSKRCESQPVYTKSIQRNRSKRSVKQTSENKAAYVSGTAVSLDKKQSFLLQEQVKEYLLNKLCQIKLTSLEAKVTLNLKI